MDVKHMERAIRLAEKGRGKTSPNPLVGAVLVKDNKIIGEGFHEFAGGPHAEINALAKAGKQAKGATMYVTLEPCCIYGRTPPCTRALIEAGIKEIIVGLEDPNPKVCGKGMQELKDTGIQVHSGVLSEEVASQNEIYVKYITTGYPFVLMKAAMSLDGKIAARRGEHTTISSGTSRSAVHILRSHYDAVAVGIGTVLADDPLLTARVVGQKPKNPLRVIIDSKLRIPLDCRIVETANEVCTLVVCANAEDKRKELLFQNGIEVIDLPAKDGRVDLQALLKGLGRRKVSSILLEGGSRLNTSVLKAGLVDKALLFIAPLLIGNNNAPSIIDLSIAGSVGLRLEISSIQRSSEDLVIEAYPANKNTHCNREGSICLQA